MISEEPEYSVQVSSHNIEKGGMVTDHVQRETMSLHLEGLLIGPQASNYRHRLVTAMNEGKLLQYSGRNMLLNCVITSLRTTHDNSIANGMSFAMTLKQVNLVKIAYDKLPPKRKAAVKPKSRSGKRNTAYRPKPDVHVVRNGQSIKDIAAYYQVSEAGIRAGMKLAGMPGIAQAGMAVALQTGKKLLSDRSKAKTKAKGDSIQMYRVQHGDNWVSIAKQFGISIKELHNLNDKRFSSYMSPPPGMVIRVK
ncbi:LysM peptidoglycan-binding domain-containing protein [Paenibacillus dendritiformis]|uniref:phage baseplate protein n=1 Tax=Paenibacillus dendritiformis TaxID=130049 RepID=UPI00143D4DC1|nr:LysM peptidoglycan-binding domain-containing protein [Paenibacillus dendritiformis]NRF98029.1 LysM peptidoglycan-binding domain-containing protein [Paenibacillus dendritiformis]